MITVLIFILVLSLLVILHELGHFVAARRAGITVEEFGLGLPPRIWGRKKGKTIYSINLLPFGGFVRLVGEDPEDHKAHQSDSFYVKTIPQRMRVVVAGVAVNFAIAVLLFYAILIATGFKFSLPLLDEHHFHFANQSNEAIILQTAPGTPAEVAHVGSGEKIVSVGGTKIESIDQFQKLIQNASSEINLETASADGTTHNYMLKPKEEGGRKIIGVSLGEVANVEYSTPAQKAFSGFTHSFNILDYSLSLTSKFVKSSFATKNFAPLSESVSGPVGIAQLTGQAVSLGWVSTMQFIALLSLNLAFLNVLPIPALDGGRFFFLILEAITRRKLYPKIEKYAHAVGFVVLLGLIALITFNDIAKLVR